MAKKIDIELVKRLREKTKAGFQDCKIALDEADGDIEKAIVILRKKGVDVARKKTGRITKEGVIGGYLHMSNKLGVLVEINCETDFVARNDDFKSFAKEIAMQVAASNPRYISVEDIPEDVIKKEKEILKEGIKGKPPHIIDKIVEGKLKKFYEEVCLLEQPLIKDPKRKVKELLSDLILKIGENIVIRRFIRFQVGEDI